jgi:hypothetical protein
MYRLKSVEAKRVEFRRTGGEWAGWIVVAVGLAVGMLPWVLTDETELQGPARWAVLSLGIAFVGAGVSILSAWQPPTRLILDQAAGVARYESDRDAVVEVPFAEYDRFEEDSFVQRGKNSSTTYYTLELVKKDGTRQRLFKTTNQRRRDTQAADIRSSLELASTSSPLSRVAKLDEVFELRRVGDKLEVSWSTRLRVLPILGMVAVAGGFVGVGLGMQPLFAQEESWWERWGLTALFTGLPLLIGGVMLYGKLAYVGQRQVLELTGSQLRYRAQGGLPGPPREWQLTLADITQVSLSPEKGMLCVREAPAAASAHDFQADRSRKPKADTELFLGDLPLGPQLSLELWLQQEITQRTGRQVF